MKILTKWQDMIPVPPVESGYTNTVWAVAFRPDGTQVLAAVGDRVLIYDAHTGEIIDNKRGHKDTVYCLAYSRDGQRWASGGADHNVIVWSAEGVGLLKYSHSNKIQCLSFNPVLQSLASCTDNDFGLWQTEEKNVNKYPTKVKCLDCDWSPDGQILAIGLYNGKILLRDKNGAELSFIQKCEGIPVWCLRFCPQKFDTSDNLLIAGSWDQKLSLYQISNGKNVKPVGTDKELGYDPCSICFYPTGEYMLMAGSDKTVTLWNKEGIKLGKIGEMKDWIWGTAVNPGTKTIFAGANNGALTAFNIEFQKVHGLYQERYAYRELMTDVIIQHLVSETRVKIRCRDYIKKIAIYKDRLAVQLPEKIIIYSVQPDDPFDMKYKAHKKINKRIDCKNLFVTSQNLVLVFEKKIQLLAFTGILVREWIMESTINFLKVISGPPKMESLIVGLQNGQVLRIFIDNAFPIQIVNQSSAITLVDISADKTKVVVIDEHESMFVYDIKSQRLLFHETKVKSAAWNLEMDDMLAYTSADTLYIKTREADPSQQKLPGQVVGFKGSKIFCISDNAMNTIDVPQSSTFHSFLGNKDFQMAYQLACLGVTIPDWRELGIQALLAKEFYFARKAFMHIRELKFIDLCETAQQMAEINNLNEIWLQSEILAYQGKYKEACSNYVKNNQIDRAIDIYTSLKKFAEAKELIRKHGKNNQGSQPFLNPQILIKQAEFERDSSNWKEAADLYQQAGKFKEAIDIYGKQDNLDQIMEICKNLEKTKNTPEIELCAFYFKKAGHHTYAKQAYLRLGDLKALMKLHIECQKWDEAQMLGKQNPEMQAMISLPYADFLSANDKFYEAQEAYKKAGRPDLSLRIIEFLSSNAITEKRFQDAAQFYWLLATESLKLVQSSDANASKQDKKYWTNYEEYLKLAEIYQAYNLVNRFVEENYRAIIQGPLYNESIFNASKFLVNNLGKRQPNGVNTVYVHYTLATLGNKLGMYKTARQGFQKLQTLKIPSQLSQQVDIEHLKIRSKPFQDKENQDDFQVISGSPSIINFGSFDKLPLIEFIPDPSIPPVRAKELLRMDPPLQEDNGGGSKWTTTAGDEQTMNFQNNQNEGLEDDLFAQTLLQYMDSQQTSDNYRPVVVNDQVMRSMRYEEVFIQDMSHFCPSCPKRYFKNMVPDVAITMCENCCRFFITDEYEFAYMELGHCPFCKNVEKDKGTKQVFGSLADMRL